MFHLARQAGGKRVPRFCNTASCSNALKCIFFLPYMRRVEQENVLAVNQAFLRGQTMEAAGCFCTQRPSTTEHTHTHTHARLLEHLAGGLARLD